MEGNFNYEKRGRPSGQKNAQGDNAGRPKKVDRKQEIYHLSLLTRLPIIMRIIIHYHEAHL